MYKRIDRNANRLKRRYRIRKIVSGTAERPRLAVFRSLNNISVQLIDDIKGHTLLSASTIDKELKSEVKNGSNVEAAKLVGKKIAERALAKGMKVVVFDRGGYLYTGRVKALADAAREAGLEF
ncbi:50S ribosomal protein L18 [Haliovirga abyssi]|uniref:Large ribosomal subunit protein uL18 n=1 Tax=Haliovirga abyssi TaxID=2996794 RepID=A0AAU9DRH6_9FUSO|nr:50S ribosomal protein L18 [Haliovirga abyssi]BDU49539.1 50S ribosomal protein L18 [Haliovirga abyssi]